MAADNAQGFVTHFSHRCSKFIFTDRLYIRRAILGFRPGWFRLSDPNRFSSRPNRRARPSCKPRSTQNHDAHSWVCQPARMMPTFANAGWIFLRAAARSNGFFPLWRCDGKTKSPGLLYSSWDFLSSNASFNAGWMGKTLADASVFVDLRCPPMR